MVVVHYSNARNPQLVPFSADTTFEASRARRYDGCACRGGAACLPCAVHKGGLVTVSLLAFCGARKCTPPMHGECTIPRCMAAWDGRDTQPVAPVRC